MRNNPGPPLVIIPCDHRVMGEHPFHMVGEKYITGVLHGADALPLLMPVLEPALDLEAVLSVADGVLLTGSPSNVAPHRYAGTAPRPKVLLDENRDRTTLDLIPLAIEQAVPLLCICRGFQELNVALGGTLHQHLEELPGRIDHRAPKDQPIEVQYGPAHTVSIMPGSLLAAITERAAIEVNSLHSQGIDRLADGLIPEAVAPDGTIEAVRVRDARSFALGVQWHPEWKVRENESGMRLFQAFGQAVRQRQQDKLERRHERG